MQIFMIAFLAGSVTMSALALFYMVITPLLARRYSAKGRYYAWLIIVIGLIISFRPQFDNPFVKITSTETTMPIIQAGNGTPFISPLDNPLPFSAASHISLSWWQIAAIVWLIGMIAFLACHTVKHYRFMKMAKRWSEAVTDKQTFGLFQNLKAELGISKQIGLYKCLSIGTPMLIGFFKPKILLPNTDFAWDELRFILNHELVHYKRKDLWYRCLVLSAKAIHWFNPLVYLMARAINTLCEISCDAEVVSSTDAETRRLYSETIIGVVKYQSKIKTALSTNFYGGKKGMKKRIFFIMDTGKKRAGAVIFCATLLLTFGTGMGFTVNAASPMKYEDPKILTNLETYSVAEYEKDIQDFKVSAPNLISSGKYTQEEVDNTITIMEEELAKLKADNGKGDYVIYKPIDEKTWVDENGDIWSSGISMIGNYENAEIVSGYGGTVTFENGNAIDIGNYETKEELLSAVKAYCDAEVKAGNISQADADKIIADFR